MLNKGTHALNGKLIGRRKHARYKKEDALEERVVDGV